MIVCPLFQKIASVPPPVGTLLLPPPVEAIVIEPAPFVMVIFDPAVNVAAEKPVPLPINKVPFAGLVVQEGAVATPPDNNTLPTATLARRDHVLVADPYNKSPVVTAD